MHQDFIIHKWSVWPPQQDDATQPTQAELLSSIPKMLKRRLSHLAKTVFCAAKCCITDNSLIPIVFSSSHGELAKSFKMMEMIEAGEDISPTSFSLSVHNAIAGLFSISNQNTTQSTVIAPGEEGIAAAFIEAMGLLEEGEEEVLIVFYDEPLVDFYPFEPYQLSSKNTLAVALIVSQSGEGTPIHFSTLSTTGDDGEQPIQLPLLVNFLSGNQQRLIIHTPRHSWCWEQTG